MRGSSLKSSFLITIHRCGKILPAPVLDLLLRSVIGSIRLAWWVPGNPLRRNCERVTELAARSGIRHRPRVIYQRLLGQISLVLRAFVRIHKHGREVALCRVPVDDGLRRTVEALLAEHGSVILAVPHNVCSVFSALGLPKDRLLLVVRNREGRHNRVSQEVISRMEVETLEVRELGPVALSRAMMRALSDGKVLVTTLDNSYRKPDAVEIDVFGVPKGFGPWAARIAAKRGVPMLPCYPRSEGGVVEVRTGKPLVSRDSLELMENYVGFFESWILRDPGSWAFLGDKRWGMHLGAAVARGPADAPVPSPSLLRAG
jgi:hypothetical protein